MFAAEDCVLSLPAALVAWPVGLSPKARAKSATGTNSYGRVPSAQYCCRASNTSARQPSPIVPETELVRSITDSYLCKASGLNRQACRARQDRVCKDDLVMYPLVLLGGDLLEEVRNAFAVGQLEAHPAEERQHLLPRSMEHHVPCSSASLRLSSTTITQSQASCGATPGTDTLSRTAAL